MCGDTSAGVAGCDRGPEGNGQGMSETNSQPDPIDTEAADIDARDPDAAEEIEELIDHAEDLGRSPDQPVDPDGAGTRGPSPH